jgi:hypothetical protein
VTWNIGGDLGTGYVPPLSPNIGGELRPPDGSISVNGFDSSEFGEVVANYSRSFSILGFDTSAVGQASIENKARLFSVPGIAQEGYGLAYVADYFQYITARPNLQGTIGQANASNYVRYIDPIGRNFAAFGEHSVEREKIVNPSGIFSQQIPTHKIADRTFRVRPVGELFSWLGDQFVFNNKRFFSVRGNGSLEVGESSVYNLNSFVFAFHPAHIYESFQEFGFAKAENFNKELFPDGLFSERFSRSLESTLGRPPTYPDGLSDGDFGWAFAGHRVRYFDVPSVTNPRGLAGLVYNKSPAIYPLGFDSAHVSNRYKVEFSPKSLLAIGNPFSEFGDAWVSRSPTEARAFGIFAFAAPENHFVAVSPTVVSPLARLPITGTVGYPFFWRKPTLIMKARWSEIGEFGLPSVRNRNIEVRRGSSRFDEHGVTLIYNHNQHFVVSAGDTSDFSEGKVENLVRYINAHGKDLDLFGLTTLLIEVVPFGIDVYPGGIDSFEWGSHLVHDGIIRPAGLSSFIAGNAFCREMAILPKGILIDEVGTPSHAGPQPIFLGPTEKFPNLTSYGIDESAIGFPRASPYRIYATPDSPAGYQENNGGSYVPVDHPNNQNLFGATFAANAIRSFQVPSADTQGGQVIEYFGNHLVTDSRTIFVFPDRLRGRVGFHSLGGISIEVEALWETETSFGETSVVDLGPKTVMPGQPPITELIGQVWASRDPEEILVQPIDFLTIPGSTRVNRPFLPFTILGGAYDFYGNVFVSNSPQYSEAMSAGLQQLMLVDDINNRMRVLRRDSLPISAGDASLFGQSSIGYRVREIWASAPMRHRPAGPTVNIRASATADDFSEVGEVAFG